MTEAGNYLKMRETNRKQFEVLMDYLKMHPILAKGHNAGIAKEHFTNEWAKIADKCNNYGPPIRDGSGWEKVWQDLKHVVKKKVMYNMLKKPKGDGTFKQYILNAIEEDVLKLKQLEKTRSRLHEARFTRSIESEETPHTVRSPNSLPSSTSNMQNSEEYDNVPSQEHSQKSSNGKYAWLGEQIVQTLNDMTNEDIIDETIFTIQKILHEAKKRDRDLQRSNQNQSVPVSLISIDPICFGDDVKTECEEPSI